MLKTVAHLLIYRIIFDLYILPFPRFGEPSEFERRFITLLHICFVLLYSILLQDHPDLSAEAALLIVALYFIYEVVDILRSPRLYRRRYGCYY